MMQRMHWSPHFTSVTSTPMMKIIVNIRSHHTDYGRPCVCVCAYDVILQLYDDCLDGMGTQWPLSQYFPLNLEHTHMNK